MELKENLIIFQKVSNNFKRCQILKDEEKASCIVAVLNHKCEMAKSQLEVIFELANDIIDTLTQADEPSDYMTRIVGMVTETDNPVEQNRYFAIDKAVKKFYPSEEESHNVITRLSILAESEFGYMPVSEFNKISS